MASSQAKALNGLTVAEIRKDFPMLSRTIGEHPLIYFNSGATSLKPKQVMEAMNQYYASYGVNVGRGVDHIGYEATDHFERVRAQVRDFIRAKSVDEIVFTRNTTEALNLLCYSYGEAHIEEGDEIIVSTTEHHANYVPWQQLALRKKAKFVIVEPNADGVVTEEILRAAMSERTKIVSLFHISNVMGATNDLAALAKVAHDYGAIFIVDGAQGIVHERPDVSAADVDFYAFSAHKILGPTGVGVLYGKEKLLNAMQPWIFGGEMIDVVGEYETTFAQSPARFEAGTMPIAEVIGLGAALEYIDAIGYDFIQEQTKRLSKKLFAGLEKMETIQVYNANNWENGVACYNVIGVHPHDAAGVYDREGISIRAGHHCNQPSMRFLKAQSTLRASVNFYNTEEEVDFFLEVSKKAGDFLDVLF